MTIIKSYTDIEQSKKLAKILPLESADMWWSKNFIYYNPTASIGIGTEYNVVYTYKFGEDDIPCWSLAALFNYLREIDFFPEIDADEVAVIMSINYYNKEEGSLLAPVHNIKIKAESFIGACYEMILKLHEEKIL